MQTSFIEYPSLNQNLIMHTKNHIQTHTYIDIDMVDLVYKCPIQMHKILGTQLQERTSELFYQSTMRYEKNNVEFVVFFP